MVLSQRLAFHQYLCGFNAETLSWMLYSKCYPVKIHCLECHSVDCCSAECHPYERHSALCHSYECLSTLCHSVDCYSAERHSFECLSAFCHYSLLLIVILLIVILLTVILLNVILLSVILVIVILLIHSPECLSVGIILFIVNLSVFLPSALYAA
jgi:hypothetical protein